MFTSTQPVQHPACCCLVSTISSFADTWFHPFIGGGVDLIWTTSESEQLTSYPLRVGTGLPASTGRTARAPGIDRFQASIPFALVGYKAYFNQWVFFRNDLRLTLDGGVNEVAIRFGIGVDVVAGRRQ